MATAFAIPQRQIKVTYCPPMPAHQVDAPEPIFGRGQWEQHPVSAEYHGTDEWSSTGVAFEDFARMKTRTHKLSGERRLPTPEWATNDKKFQRLLVHFLEYRVSPSLHVSPKGTLKARLKRATDRIIAKRAKQLLTMDKLCQRFVEAKQLGLDTKRLIVAIENLDTLLRYTANGGAETIAAIVYLYYRVGYDSKHVAAELKLKPPHVRRTLFCLYKCWSKMHGEKYKPVPRIGRRPPKVPKFCITCGALLTKKHRRWCGPACYPPPLSRYCRGCGNVLPEHPGVGRWLYCDEKCREKYYARQKK